MFFQDRYLSLGNTQCSCSKEVRYQILMCDTVCVRENEKKWDGWIIISRCSFSGWVLEKLCNPVMVNICTVYIPKCPKFKHFAVPETDTTVPLSSTETDSLCYTNVDISHRQQQGFWNSDSSNEYKVSSTHTLSHNYTNECVKKISLRHLRSK